MTLYQVALVGHVPMLTIPTPHHFHHIGGGNKVIIEEMTLLVVAVPMLVELFAHIRMETAAANTLDILSHCHSPSYLLFAQPHISSE
jgi:hypothetical protein